MFEVSTDGSSWTTDTDGMTKLNKNSVHMLGIVPAHQYYRVRLAAGSNSSYAVQAWLEQQLG